MALRPQINTITRINTSLSSADTNRTAVMIGTANWGPINTLTNISRRSSFIGQFGTDNDDVTGYKAVDLFFRNGSGLSFVRVANGDEAKSTITLQNSTTDVIVLTAKYTGTYGDNIMVSVTEIGSNRAVTITDGNVTENYNNAGQGFTSNDDIVAAITAGSTLVDAEVETGQGESNLVDAITETAFTGGDDGATSIDDTEYTTVITDILDTEDFNYLLIPGKTEDAFNGTILGLMNNRVTDDSKRSRFISGVAVDETLTTITQRTSSGKRLSLIAPNVLYGTTVLDGSYLAAAYTGLLCSLDVGLSGTNKVLSIDDLSVNVTSGRKYYSKPEQEELLNVSTIPVALVNNTFRPIRAVTTLSNTSDINYEEVIVDNLDEVIRSVEGYLVTLLGQPNTEDRRDIYAQRVNTILENLQSNEVITDFEPAVVDEGSSPDSIVAEIEVQPTFSTNFITLTINV